MVKVDPRLISSKDITLPYGALITDIGANRPRISQLIPGEAMPTIGALSASALAGGTTYNARSGGAVNPAFGYPGTPTENLIQAGPAIPLTGYLSAAIGNQNTFSPRPFMSSFYHTGTSLDLIQYGSGDDVTIYVDGLFLARILAAIRTGTAQAGGASSITLDSGANGTTGYYNTYWVRITGGTGVLNETRQITAYNGSTKVATVASAWTTTPDATTTFAIQDTPLPCALDGVTGSVRYLPLRWTQGSTRLIQVIQTVFSGVVADAATIQPGPGWGTMPLVVVGDSFWAGEERPANLPRLLETTALHFGFNPVNLACGSTGYVSYGNNRLPFTERVAPPDGYYLAKTTVTAGTYTISLTYNGVTKTTGSLSWNANATAVQTALEALSNVTGAPTYPGGERIHVSGGDFGSPLVVVSANLPGFTLSVDSSGLTGGPIVITPYLGDLVRVVPKDSDGNSLPFILLIPGSGNDTAYFNTGTYGNAVSDNVSAVVAAIKANFPTAIPIMTGIIGDAGASSNTISSGAWSNNQVILTAITGQLPKIRGRDPVIPVYTAIGEPYLLNGLGTVAAPVAGTRAFMKSITNAGHPTSPGTQYISRYMIKWIGDLLRGLAA